jgi:hypothetical protein
MEDTYGPSAGSIRPEIGDRLETGRRLSQAALDEATAATAAAIADPAATVHDVLKAAEAEEELFLAARAAGWDIHGRQPGPGQPRAYVTEVSVPWFGDGGVQRLYAPMKQPGPEPEPEAGI